MSTSVNPSILLVEDDVRLSELVSHYLENNDFRVTTTARGDEVVNRVQREAPDLVILDLGLPGEDGFSICRQLRPRYANPILILTARDNDFDQVLGLELGADDYVIKPVEPRVLLARISALLRRSRAQPRLARNSLRFGRLLINTVSRTVSLDSQPVALSSAEFDLLAYLAEHAGEIQSRATLFQHLYGREYDGVERLLDVRISHLRKKLGEDADSSERIKTIWGQGYLFVPDAW
ncbi:MAG TPA: response regulator [Steroidobacteraceae bacterium]|jgi:two-component system OmpR family response regulator|nr:response regulator [Steroidobacteraceae bacterium]